MEEKKKSREKKVEKLREKARSAKRAHVYSTSDARANFAEALESAQVDKAIVGFDRYGRPVAALVPMDAIRILAGYEDRVDPALRVRLRKMARVFLSNVQESAAIEVYDDLDAVDAAPPADPPTKARGRRGGGDPNI